MTKIAIVSLAVAAVSAFAYSRNRTSEKEALVNTAAAQPDAAGLDPEKTDWAKVDWGKRLTPQEFDIMRQAGTERAFTGEYWDFFEEGAVQLPRLRPAAVQERCQVRLRTAAGRASTRRSTKDAVVEIEDNSHGMRRVEVRCRRCGAHLGHVFDDGPTATGLRYCMNSASIKFDPETPFREKRRIGEQAIKPGACRQSSGVVGSDSGTTLASYNGVAVRTRTMDWRRR